MEVCFGWILPHRTVIVIQPCFRLDMHPASGLGGMSRKIDEHALQHPLVFEVGPLRGNSKFSHWRWNITILPPPLPSVGMQPLGTTTQHRLTVQHPLLRVADHLKIRWLASLAWPPPLSNLMRGHFSSNDLGAMERLKPMLTVGKLSDIAKPHEKAGETQQHLIAWRGDG
jgi:hypothetical protein